MQNSSLTLILSLLASPVLRHWRFTSFMYILGCICIVVADECVYLPYYVKLFFELFLDLYLLCCLLSLLPKPIAVVLEWITTLFLYIVAVVDLFCVTKFDTTISPSIVQLMLETNTGEISNFASVYLGPDVILSVVGGVLLLFVIHVVSLFGNIRFRTRKPLTGLFTTLGVLLGLYGSFPNKQYLADIFGLRSIDAIENYLAHHNWASRAMYSPVHRTVFSVRVNYIGRRQLGNVITAYDKIDIKDCSFTSNNIVLIIGESYNKHHSQLYGYRYATTPFQLERQKRGELYVFQDAVTPYNLTSDVFKNMFSTNDLSKHQSWTDYPLFTQVFHKSGYNVTFITNQFVPKQDKEFFDFSGGMFLNNESISSTQFHHRNIVMHNDDIDLLADYDSLARYEGKHNLVIFHLMGQHFDYKNRFPTDSIMFKPSDYERTGINESEKQTIADYDNATLYNDFVVDKILRKFEDKEAIVLYLADHGEEVFDDLRTSGRVHGPITRETAKNEFQIPFWIWCSASYANKNKMVLQQIVSSLDKRFSSDDLPHVLIGLGGIKCSSYNPLLDILNRQYDVNRKRLLRGSVEYESLMK